MKFEIGDNVRIINFRPLEGCIGIIQYIDTENYLPYAVEFFNVENIKDVRLHDCDNKIPSGNGYWLREHNFELMPFNVYSEKNSISNFKVCLDGTLESKFERKEENKMNCEKILRLYRDREINKIDESYRHQKIDILKKDELYFIASEMIEQMNVILEDDGQTDRVEILSDSPRYLKKETKELLEDLEKNIRKERIQLHETLDEVNAMLEIAPDYNEAMKILERYGIINKKTKKIVNE